MEYVDVDNIQVSSVSSMVSSSEECYRFFIGYKDDDYKIKPLRIMLPKTSASAKGCDGETKWINFLIKNDDF